MSEKMIKLEKKYQNQPEFKLCTAKTANTLSRPSSEDSNNSNENNKNHDIFGFEKDIQQIAIDVTKGAFTQTESVPVVNKNKYNFNLKNIIIIVLILVSIYLSTIIADLSHYKKQKQLNSHKFDDVDFSLNISYEDFYEQTKLKPLSQLQAKCSHNSFEAGNYYEQLNFNKNTPYQGGSLMLEFDIMHDIQENSEEYGYYMSHLQESHDGQTLLDGLQQVQDFHNQNQDHLPIFLTINIKPQLRNLEYGFNPEKFYYGLERTIVSALNINDIYTPAELLNGEKNLFEAVTNNGYPQVQQLLGKIFIVLDVSQEDNNDPLFYQFYENYINQVEQSLMWGTLDTKLIQRTYYTSIKQYMEQTQNYNKIFINMKANYFYDSDKYAYLKGIDVLKEAQNLNLLTRGYVLNNMNNYIKYRDMGMNFLCTDKIFNHNFAVAY
ncbi:PLC-like phosphodiesterase, TIM beta/alpha-barrel domain [Pseudocohnilembus persalinus]|uniref:PLC-like phosphodiesterase, TIM beta/alpha-barrel domain n=1 Tax=Pseudocohnilembus persalinus TaxID=266149 RepID=A0A0V0QVX3_PSEPJ|nr:PLC-like phosphodiesterase, TIM beta/alpha-barrel domain [Pseudocohnilembus persalinus]|eukprot:KRX06337.1 PLC-like phosphodiesterase, TIM beta/alpha-barrel domain [Pseudocohnilembus persalinus]